MQAKVTIEILEDGKKIGEPLATIVDVHSDVAVIARDNPVSALFWIFGRAEMQFVRQAEGIAEQDEGTEDDEG